MMKETDYKYRNDLFSPEELSMFKQQLNATSDEALEKTMREVWMEDDVDTSDIDEERLRQLKARIDGRIDTDAAADKQVSGRMFVRRVWQVAAAVLLPVLILTTIYFYRESRVTASGLMVVSTGAREKAQIVLPDGTRVALNADSKLTYAPHLYNKDTRRIEFEGEGYFEVSKDPERPFRIAGSGLDVEVLGTTFNLNARTEQPTAELYLEEGSVRMASTRSGREVVLSPNQRAVLNRADGSITVVAADDEQATAWRRDELVFKDVPLDEVLERLEATYGVTIETDGRLAPSGSFTGTLFTSDLFESLKIIEKTYGLKTDIQGKKIVLSQQD